MDQMVIYTNYTNKLHRVTQRKKSQSDTVLLRKLRETLCLLCETPCN